MRSKLASPHCLQNGHWKSLAMITQMDAVESPRMRPRSARSLMLSGSVASVATAPFADAVVVGVVVGVETSLAGAPEREQAASAVAVRSRRRVLDMFQGCGQPFAFAFRGKLRVGVEAHKPLFDNGVHRA